MLTKYIRGLIDPFSMKERMRFKFDMERILKDFKANRIESSTFDLLEQQVQAHISDFKNTPHFRKFKSVTPKSPLKIKFEEEGKTESIGEEATEDESAIKPVPLKTFSKANVEKDIINI